MFAARPYHQQHHGLFGYNQPHRGPRPAFNHSWVDEPQAPCCGAYEYPGAAPCACSARPQPTFGAYHGYDQPPRYDAPPQEYGYGYERRRPQPHPHHGHHGPHGFRHPYHHHQHEHRASLAEAELEARLAEERLALLKLEHELKRKEAQLKARERELQFAQQVPGAFIDLTFRASPEPAKPKPAVRQCKRAPTSNGSGFALNLGGGEREPRPYAQSWADFWPQLQAQALAESQSQAQAPAKPQPQTQKPQPKPQPQRPAAQAQGAKHPFEDTLKMLILQSLRPEGSTREKQPQGAPKQQEAQAKAKPAPAPVPAPKQEEQQPKPAASTSPKPAAEGSLIDQLTSRYEKEGEDEVRDTIQAVFNSLLLNHVKQQPASSSASTSTAAAPSSGAPKQQAGEETAIADTTNTTTGNVNNKGKGKARAASPEGNAPASSADINAALERVSRIETTFQRLAADFTFPSHLDFINPKPTTPSSTDGYESDSASSTSSAGSGSTFPHLAFTARNHAVRYYEQTLSALLQELDLVESWGSEEVRRRRRAVVGLVEEAIGEVEGEVEGRWRSWSAKQEAAGDGEKEKNETGVEETLKAAEEAEEAAPEVEDVAVGSAVVSEPEPEVQDPKVDVDAEAQTLEPERTTAAESEAEVVPEAVPEIPTVDESLESSPEFQVPAPESTESSPAAPSADIHTPEPTSTDTPTSTVTEEDEYLHADSNNSEAGEETFLLADSQSTVTTDELKNKTKREERKHASVEVEDLGSDWSELDA